MRIIENNPISLPHGKSLNFRWPYQAKVINVLDMAKKKIVVIAFIFPFLKSSKDKANAIK